MRSSIANLFQVVEEASLTFNDYAIERLGQDRHDGRVEQEEDDNCRSSRFIVSLLSMYALTSSIAVPEG